ncbi:MAG TPA: LON peptidase substrate-binding domain-containing protein [Thermoleophilaceae bacterium]|nr:LON peptidase substrate-binding domain-containing protein [Thermoleophilaceae bacterium]
MAAFGSFPLFPLGLVALPGEVVPLHIFEERYKTMVGECLEDEREFGILWAADDGLKEVGCTVAITELLERAADGRMNILTRGSAPFRMVRRIEDMPYPAGEIELLEDGAAAVDTGLGHAARERYAELVERVTDSRPEETELMAMSAYDMAATVELPLEAKQRLLELRSEEERLRAMGELLEAAMRRLEQVELAAERARSNGRVRS